MKSILDNFREMSKVLEQFSTAENLQKIEDASEWMAEAIERGNKIISCGNGGSMCDAMHFAEELSGRFRENRRALPAVSISDPSHISCVANDYGYDFVFSRYIEALGQKGDVLLAISTSGNSKNVLEAVSAAKKKGMFVVSLTGKDGGKLGGLSNLEIRVSHSGFADRIQEIHIKVIHCLIQRIEERLA
jgi:D-sedoheptulose 7-phosphate isomerase